MVHAAHRTIGAHRHGVAQTPGRAAHRRLARHGPGTRGVGDGVVHVVVTGHVHEPHQGGTGAARPGHAIQRGQVVDDEGGLEQEVLGRVPGEGQLGKDGHVGALRLGPGQVRHDALDVGGQPTDVGVELAQRHAQPGHGESLPARHAHPAWQAAVVALPAALADLAERSAAPETVTAVLGRLVDERPDALERMAPGHGSDAGPLATTLVRVIGASNALGRLCVVDGAALDVLDALDDPVPVDVSDPAALARSKRLELLRIAARDLLGRDPLEAVGAALADLAQRRPAGCGGPGRGRAPGRDRHGKARGPRAQLRQ